MERNGQHPGHTRPPIDPLLGERHRQRRLALGLPVEERRHGGDRHWFRRQVLAAIVTLVSCGVAGMSLDLGPSPASSVESTTGAAAQPTTVEVHEGEQAAPAPTEVVHLHDPVPAQVLAVIADYESEGNTWPAPACMWLVDDLAAHDLPPWMLAVAWRESRCQRDAYNGDRSTGDDSWGLFQINALGATLRTELAQTCAIDDPAVLLDADTSLRCAAALYAKYGYRPWHAGTYFR